MHEMSLCEGILNILEDHARTQGFQCVKAVWLEIGALSGVEIDALSFSFEVITKNTLAEQAKLHIIQIPGQAWCMQCAKTVTIQQRFDACPHCGGYQLQVSSGEEMRVKEIEVE